jgi:hypothetical protein
MKQKPVLICLLFCVSISNLFGQKISETNLTFGIIKTSSPVQPNHWNDSPLPRYFTFNVTESWYGNDHWLSLRKELGLNLQYSPIHLGGGGLAAQGYYSGNVLSLIPEVALLARFKINSTLAFSIGPIAQILAIGNTNVTYSYSTIFTNPPSSGLIINSGLNRDYFNQPSYGMKARLFESALTENAIIGLNISYLWTKQESSNFYASNYTLIALFIGFKKEKKK